MKIGLCILICLAVTGLQAQELDESQAKRLYLSLTGGLGFMGPKGDIEDQMRVSGLDDRQHPNSIKIPIINLAANYWLMGRQGVSLEVGMVDFTQVKGFEEVGAGNSIFLNSAIWSTSLNYMIGSQNRKRYFTVGPALFLHHVKDDGPGHMTDAKVNVLAGFNAGYTVHLIDKTRWFLALKANGRIAPKSEIGPFVTENQTGIINPQPTNQRSEFEQTKVQINGFNIGLTAGIKLRARAD